MSAKPIYLYNHKVLRTVCEDITEEEFMSSDLQAEMYYTMQKANGVGLAAPQIGLTKNIFVTDVGNDRKIFINPRMIEEFGVQLQYQEGCLSIPKLYANVTRFDKLGISYRDENWNYHEEQFDKLLARVIQHEYDHLKGILFIDHLKLSQIKPAVKFLRDIQNGKHQASYLTK